MCWLVCAVGTKAHLYNELSYSLYFALMLAQGCKKNNVEKICVHVCVCTRGLSGWWVQSNASYLNFYVLRGIKEENSLNLFEDITALLKQRKCMAVISHLVSSSHHTITPSLCPCKETPSEIQTASSSLFGLCLHPWPASCPRVAELTLGERSQLQQRATDPGPEEGGSDSEERG